MNSEMDANQQVNELLSDFRTELQQRQEAIDNGADDETLDEMTAELHRKLDMAEQLEFECIKVTILRKLERGYILSCERVYRESIDKQRKALCKPELQMRTFYGYLQLPEIVVRKILNFLTNPKDLLNLLIAFPTEEKFSPLTKEQLKFDLKFSETPISCREPIWDNDHQLRQLGLRSDHHRKVVLRQFEHFLVNDISNTDRITIPDFFRSRSETFYRSISIDSVVRSMEGVAFKEWNKFPVTSKVAINMDSGQIPEEMVGSSIWHAEIRIPRREWVAADMGLEYFRRNVCRCLKKMPNLRNLHLRHDDLEEMDIFGDGQHFEPLGPVQLPELPFLKSLNFHETKFINANTFRMFKMLLDKYGGQLNQLGFTISCALEENQAQLPVDLPSCPNLTLLSFIDQCVHSDWYLPYPSSGMLLRFMSNFRDAKLKKIRLSLIDTPWLNILDPLLVHISLTFRKSLEHLELEFGRIGLGHGPNPTLDPIINWLRYFPPRMHFPKLVYFGTNLESTRHLYEIVIQFPVLEILEIGKCVWVERDRETACCNLEGDTLLKCWTEWIWKELPRLKWIGYYKNWCKESITEENGTERQTGKFVRFVNFCKKKIQRCFRRWT